MASDLISSVLVPLIAELIKAMPELIDAWIDGDGDAAERTAKWIKTSQANAAADARWWAARAANEDPPIDA